jgi:hypothetical protein
MNAPAVTTDHAWLPRATCDSTCVGVDAASPRWLVVLRVTLRLTLAVLLVLGAPLALVPGPGQLRVRRFYCQMLLRVFGFRISVSGAPIERASLRQLPAVVDTVADRLLAGQTVVAFPEGTTWCGVACGSFYPAMFQAAIDAGRPVQPLRLTYHHVDGLISTAPAFVGDDTLLAAMCRLITQRRTLAHVHVESLQLPGTDRRALAGRCQSAVGVGVAQRPGRRHVLVA